MWLRANSVFVIYVLDPIGVSLSSEMMQTAIVVLVAIAPDLNLDNVFRPESTLALVHLSQRDTEPRREQHQSQRQTGCTGLRP